jgi:transcriptional regulator with GAF, ATPase, and Fis domain
VATHNISSAYPNPETELDPIVRLAMSVSSRLARAHGAELMPAILDSLDDIADATGADASQLIEFSTAGAVIETFGSARSTTTPAVQQIGVLEGWLKDRLARGEVVATTLPEELPQDAVQARELARRTGACSILAVPAASGGEVVGGLVLHTCRSARRWAPALIERLRMLAEIFAAALHRRRQDMAMRANVEMIEKLNARLEADNVYLKEEVKSYHDFDDIVGESPALRTALARLGLVAQTNSSVLLIGPTGSGKELFARALHERSRRHTRPLVRVNCAALPPTLVESELFGHEKGAFTGAVGARQGRFELADGGTIFLDEIGDLPPDIQVKFLRVLQEGEFERVGSSRTKRVDVRVIAATHQDLEAAVAEGRFRADLYYRLSVYPIRLPSLKERTEDIPQLVWFFINKHQRELGRRITDVPASVMDAFIHHDWPGNVRELENVVERSMIASKTEVLQLDEPLAVVGRPQTKLHGDALDDMQRAHIEAVLSRCGWRINGKGNAAERLGVHPNTLRFRLKKLNLNRPVAS